MGYKDDLIKIPGSLRKPGSVDGSVVGGGINGKPKLTRQVLRSIRNYEIFFHGLEQFDPEIPSLKGNYLKDGENAREIFVNDDNFLMSKKYLSGILNLPGDAVAKLTQSHAEYIEHHINHLIDSYGIETFGNVLPMDLEWSQSYSGLSGYVLIGGGQYSWMSYLVIKQIRKTGSTLPIEIWLDSKKDYERDFCERVLPKLNAKCNVFDDKLAKSLEERFGVGGYQYKMLALLSSRFENILYLDSDGFPATNLDYLFESEYFLETGMIVWPDAWARTTNPSFYDIAGLQIKPTNKYTYNRYDKKKAEGGDLPPYNEYDFSNTWFHTFEGTLPDPTSETGILLINKTKHLKTLMLALYYNIYGPQYYYPLLTQGAAGEGDKETFIAAATIMNESYHQVKKTFRWCGYFREDNGQFASKALGHYDPKGSVADPDGDKVQIIFMHLSYPKLLPGWLIQNHDLVYKDTDKHIRMYFDVYNSAGYDFDLRIFQIFTEALCPNYFDKKGNPIDGQIGISKKDEYMGSYLSFIKENEEDNAQKCSSVFIPHLKWLKETTKEYFPETGGEEN